MPREQCSFQLADTYLIQRVGGMFIKQVCRQQSTSEIQWAVQKNRAGLLLFCVTVLSESSLTDGQAKSYRCLILFQVTIQGFRSYRDQTEIEPFSPKHNVISEYS